MVHARLDLNLKVPAQGCPQPYTIRMYSVTCTTLPVAVRFSPHPLIAICSVTERPLFLHVEAPKAMIVAQLQNLPLKLAILQSSFHTSPGPCVCQVQRTMGGPSHAHQWDSAVGFCKIASPGVDLFSRAVLDSDTVYYSQKNSCVPSSD